MLLEIAKEYLRHCAADPEAADPASPGAAVLSKATSCSLSSSRRCGAEGEGGRRGGAGGAPPPAAAASRSLHHPVSAPFRGTQTPGLLEAQLLLARSRYLGGDLTRRCAAAQRAQRRAPLDAREPGTAGDLPAPAADRALPLLPSPPLRLQADPGYAAASLLHAQVLLRQEKYAAAHAVLEGALAHNFALKDAPVFQLVKARVLQTQGEHAEALALLQAAYALPGATPPTAPPRRPTFEHDRCSIHLGGGARIARSRRHEPAPTPPSLPAPASAPRRSDHLAGPDRYGRCTRRCRSRRRRRP